jgi:hypothetical protein
MIAALRWSDGANRERTLQHERIIFMSVKICGIGILWLASLGLAQTIEAHWQWVQSDKHGEMANCAPAKGKDSLSFEFTDHEYTWSMIEITEPVNIKNPNKGWLRQLGENKVDVTLAFDQEAPITESWGIANHADYIRQTIIAPRERDDKLLKKILTSKQLTITFQDSEGHSVSNSYDLSGLREQMSAHKEHVNKFGVMEWLPPGLGS